MSIAIKQENVTDYTTVEVLSTDTVQPNAQNAGPVQIVAGPQGPKGDKGDKGDTGEQGPKGDKGDKGDKDDKGDEDDKDDTHNDEQSDSQKDEQDDTSDTAPEDRGYMEYLNALGNIFTGDAQSFEKLLPSGVWELMCLGKAEEFGYIPTKEEVVEIFIEESFADVNESEFIDSYELSIYQEKSVDSDTIDMLQKNLRSYFIMTNIDEAYEVSFRFVMEKDGEMTEDERKSSEKSVQDMTDKYIKKIDEALAAKEKELMAI